MKFFLRYEVEAYTIGRLWSFSSIENLTEILFLSNRRSKQAACIDRFQYDILNAGFYSNALWKLLKLRTVSCWSREYSIHEIISCLIYWSVRILSNTNGWSVAPYWLYSLLVLIKRGLPCEDISPDIAW